jgi:hypothetical protein
VVRTGTGTAAITLRRHEFRTRGTNGSGALQKAP